MSFWLIKSEPSTYSWAQMHQDKTTLWDGVRNYQARNYMKMMKKGDLAFFYHSGDDKAIQGIVQVTREFYPDPTFLEEKGDWVVVDVTYNQPFKQPVTLKSLKADAFFVDLVLVKQSRLSVMPVSVDHWAKIIDMSQ